LALDDISSAQTAIARAEELAVAAEEIVHLAWACKVKGDIATAAAGRPEEAGGLAYTQCLNIAEPRGLRPLEAHCHAGLARFNDRLGRLEEAVRHRRKAEEIYRILGL
jgi:hypothetical protein